jgi:HD-GYP domain-containing protein (c-di-GMP phosphodiesterase class II)
MVGCLSSAMDLVSPEVVGHHCRVGTLAYRLGEVAGLPGRALTELVLAGLLHDVGAFSLKDRLSALAFDTDDTTHAETGYRLLASYPGFAGMAELVRMHHTPWSDKREARKVFTPEAELGNLLSLADRVDTLLPRTWGGTVEHATIASRIRSGKDRLFPPRWVDAFEALTGQPDFWEQLLAAGTTQACLLIPDEFNPLLSSQDISSLSRLFSQIIDFRCRFTATHSRGVAAMAVALGREMGLPEPRLEWLEIAGELHDIGKLGVPSEIILKPAALDQAEMTVMRGHASHGYSVLFGVPGMSEMAVWVGQHHERLDGTGYPMGVDASLIGLESRVMAVSDVFTALTEDRPYRKGMNQDQTVRLLSDMARNTLLDGDVVGALLHRLADMDELRRASQALALADFERFAGGLAH